MNEEILQLPFEIQFSLAVGYLAYRLATTGLDKRHRTGDFVLQVFVFSAVQKSIEAVSWELIPEMYWNYGLILLISAIFTFVLSSLWRAFGIRLVSQVMRKLSITQENFNPSTWDAIINQTNHPWCYVSVLLNDGTYFDSNLETLPNGLPQGPIDLDTEGNIAMYVTSKIDDVGNRTDYELSQNEADITYIPVSNIARVSINRLIKVTSSLV